MGPNLSQKRIMGPAYEILKITLSIGTKKLKELVPNTGTIQA